MLKTKQFDFQKIPWKYRYSHGGQLRNSRAGRGARTLSSKAPIHLVLKANKHCLRSGFRTYKRYFLIQNLLDKYSRKFFIKIEQVSIQNDHLHLLIRASKRAQLQNFFRVFSGQVAQRLNQEGLLSVTDTPLWKYRPFTRVIKGWKAYKIVRNYVQLNEQEALGKISYQKLRLKGLSSAEWELLWT